MKKRILSSVLAFVLATGLCSVVPVNSSNYSYFGITAEATAADKDGFVIETDSDGFKYVSKYTGSSTAVVIPDGVTWIDDEAFMYNDKITSVTFPKSFDGWVGKNAFWGCIALKTVKFEGTIGEICDYAFGACIDLTSVTFAGGINGGSEKGGIDYCAFAFCNSLQTVNFKDSTSIVDYIGEFAFYNCFNLSSINLPVNTSTIYSYAFANCINLDKITIPNKTKKIYDYAIGYMYDYLSEKPIFADWHTSANMLFYNFTDLELYYESKVQKSIKMTVTKNSVGEEYAKNNNIPYNYAKSSTSTTSNSTASKKKLAAPIGFKTSTESSKIVLSWNTVDGADAYKVYMYDSAAKKYKAYKTVSSAKCTVSGLKSGTTYKFKVAALDKVDGKYVAGTSSKTVTASTT